MAEVFHFNEVTIKEVSGTTETAFDGFAQDVNIKVAKELFEVTDDAGVVLKRHQVGQSAEMSISKLFAANEINITDGNGVKVYFANSLGTTAYLLGSCYVPEKGWKMSEEDTVVHNVTIVGKSFGTI